MGVWQGVAMDSPKYHPGPTRPFYARSQGRRPAVVFYSFGDPTPYASVSVSSALTSNPFPLPFFSLSDLNGKHRRLLFPGVLFSNVFVQGLMRKIRDGGGVHGRVARGGHGLYKVLLGPALPYPSTACGRATPETAKRPQSRRPGGPKPSSTPLDIPRHTPMLVLDDSLGTFCVRR
jgi:hypothetical protein